MPAHLRVYDVRDWRGVGCHPECSFWAAVKVWRDEHPTPADDLAPMTIIDGPDVPLHEGDV